MSKNELFTFMSISAPIVGYLVSFFYQVGYAEHFGIPTEIIQLELTNIILSIVIVLAIQITILFLLDSYISHFGKIVEKNTIAQSLLTSFLIFSFVFFLLTKSTFLIILTLLIIVMIYFVAKCLPKGNPIQEKNGKTILEKNYNFKWRTIMAFIITVIATSQLIGNIVASGKENYLVDERDRTQVLLTKYGSTYIFGVLDHKSEKLESFRLIDSTEISNFRLKNKKINLTIKK